VDPVKRAVLPLSEVLDVKAILTVLVKSWDAKKMRQADAGRSSRDFDVWLEVMAEVMACRSIWCRVSSKGQDWIVREELLLWCGRT